MKWLLCAFAAVVLLAVADFAVYVTSNGMECQGDNCSTAVDVTEALATPLVIVGAALLLAIVAGTVVGAVRGLRSPGSR